MTIINHSITQAALLCSVVLVPNVRAFTSPLTSCLSTTNPLNSMWKASDPEQAMEARESLHIWPLDEANAMLLNQVHPRSYDLETSASSLPHKLYDLIAIGAGAGGLVSSKQAARRGAKSAMISEYLAGGDCLNVGCVPSKALIRSARAIAEIKRASEFGIILALPGASQPAVQVDFAAIMKRMRGLRANISPADGHEGTTATGAHVYQGRGRFTSNTTIEVNGITLTFKKAVIATGGRPLVPNVPGLKHAPYTTNEILFNLETLPPRMVILGAGVIALEMAQTFSRFGSKVTVIQRSTRLFETQQGDKEAAELLKSILEKEDGVSFISGTISEVKTMRERKEDNLPLMKVLVTPSVGGDIVDLDCECLLVATGRIANVEDVGLDKAGVDFELGKGVIVNNLAQSVSNPNIYAVGDCVAGVPRLTHMSGEMAKQVVQNALFNDTWKLSDFVVPAVMYTEPEYATVGIASQDQADKRGIAVDVYRAGLEHNDRAILESDNRGFCKIFCKKGTDEIIGATLVAARAGEMINEVTLAMRHNIGLRGIGRNIHAYPTTGEAVMGCGIQFINSRWERINS